MRGGEQRHPNIPFFHQSSSNRRVMYRPALDSHVFPPTSPRKNSLPCPQTALAATMYGIWGKRLSAPELLPGFFFFESLGGDSAVIVC